MSFLGFFKNKSDMVKLLNKKLDNYYLASDALMHQIHYNITGKDYNGKVKASPILNKSTESLMKIQSTLARPENLQYTINLMKKRLDNAESNIRAAMEFEEGKQDFQSHYGTTGYFGIASDFARKAYNYDKKSKFIDMSLKEILLLPVDLFPELKITYEQILYDYKNLQIFLKQIPLTAHKIIILQNVLETEKGSSNQRFGVTKPSAVTISTDFTNPTNILKHF